MFEQLRNIKATGKNKKKKDFLQIVCLDIIKCYEYTVYTGGSISSIFYDALVHEVLSLLPVSGRSYMKTFNLRS